MLQAPVVSDILQESGRNGNASLAYVTRAVHALELYPIRSKLPKNRSPPHGRSQLPSLDSKSDVAKSHENPFPTENESIQTEDTDSVDSLVTLPYASTSAQLQARVKAELGKQLFGALKQRLQSRQRMLARTAPVPTPVSANLREAEPVTHSTQASSLREARKPDKAAALDQRQGGRRTGKVRRHASRSAAPSQFSMDYLAGAMPTATQCSWRPEMPAICVAQSVSSRTCSLLMTKGERLRRCDVNGLSMWQVDQTSEVDLLRVNRLKAIPNYNRGLFAGLDCFVTRSGLFIVGLTRGPDGRRIHPRAWHLLYGSVDAGEVSSGVSGRVGADFITAEASGRKAMAHFSSRDDRGDLGSKHQNLKRFSDVCRKDILRGILSDEERVEAVRLLRSLRKRALEMGTTPGERQGEEREEVRHRIYEGTPLSGDGFSCSSAAKDASSLPAVQPRYSTEKREGESTAYGSDFLPVEADEDEYLNSDLVTLSRTHTPRRSLRLAPDSLLRSASGSDISNSLLDRTLFSPELEQFHLKGNKTRSFIVGQKRKRKVRWSDSGNKVSCSSLSMSTGVISRKGNERDYPTSLFNEADVDSFFTPEEGSVALPNLISTLPNKVVTPDSTDRDHDRVSSALQSPYDEVTMLSPRNTDVSVSSENPPNTPKMAPVKVRGRRGKGIKSKLSSDHMISDDKKLDDESQADILNVNFPKAAEHVQLRKAANRILDDLDFDGGSFLGLARFSDYSGDDLEYDQLPLENGKPNNITSDRSRDAHGLKEVQELEAHMGRLQNQIDTEVEQDLADLIARRDQLKAEVKEQQQLIDAFQMDLHNLSKERKGAKGDAFAIQLTAEVNRYAMEHRLQLEEIYQELLEDDDISMGGLTESMLKQFVRGKSEMCNVGTQVTDYDLGYIEDDLKETIEQMDEMFYHEKALRDAIDLTHVALSKIISFHASLELESTCKECFFLFEQPRTLWPCGHTFCQLCLAEMYNKNGDLLCSECGSVCIVGYTPNLSIELIASYQMLQDAKSKSPSGGKTIENTLQSLLSFLLSTRDGFAAPSAADTR
ncbi:unnamed protein product [Phytomonas sp. EM1]|nr:unnamed protein product [Phytomonas sp. EM1]|eukprot:CCW63736.1 unnamed protein product [Phytomonas sp. isolate EM1]